MASAYSGSQEASYSGSGTIVFGTDEASYSSTRAGIAYGSDEGSYTSALSFSPIIPPNPLPASAFVDAATATCIGWYHDNRIYMSFAGKTYCRDMLDLTAGWTDCGYGYVASRFVLTRFNFPNIAFLAANMSAVSVGDPVYFATLTHRSLTPQEQNIIVVPNKVIRFRPYDGAGEKERSTRKKAETFRLWGEITIVGDDRIIGRVTATTDSGYQEVSNIYSGIYLDGLLLEQSFSPAVASWLISIDVEFFSNVIDGVITQNELQYIPLDFQT